MVNINERRGRVHEVIRLFRNESRHRRYLLSADNQQHRFPADTPSGVLHRQRRLLHEPTWPWTKMAKNTHDTRRKSYFLRTWRIGNSEKLRWSSEIIHCQGWMSYIVPLFIKAAYNVRTDIQRHKNRNVNFQGRLIKGHSATTSRTVFEFKDITVDSLSAYKDDFDFMDILQTGYRQ